jgi:hypothetical protein
MRKLTTSQEAIAKAVLADVLQVLSQQNTLTTLMLNSHQIVKIFRISPYELSVMRQHNIVPFTRKKRVFYYNPLDILDFLTRTNYLN